jgi:hypothetical protein
VLTVLPLYVYGRSDLWDRLLNDLEASGIAVIRREPREIGGDYVEGERTEILNTIGFVLVADGPGQRGNAAGRAGRLAQWFAQQRGDARVILVRVWPAKTAKSQQRGSSSWKGLSVDLAADYQQGLNRVVDMIRNTDESGSARRPAETLSQTVVRLGWTLAEIAKDTFDATEAYSLLRRFETNFVRVTRLFAAVHEGKDEVSRGFAPDILRMLVVYLHAAMEDFLRGVARIRLPDADAKVVDKFPFPGQTDPKKVSLGELVGQRRKRVEDLIREGVELYLKRASFNHVKDITSILRRCKFDTGPLKPLFPDIDPMIKRRHKFVHEADFADTTSKVPAEWTTADTQALVRWMRATCLLVVEVVKQLLPTSRAPALDPEFALLNALLDSAQGMVRDAQA